MSKLHQNNIVSAMTNSRGRFFSLSTKQGDLINAQFVESTPSYVVIYDRNRFEYRKLAKSSLSRFKMGDTKVIA